VGLLEPSLVEAFLRQYKRLLAEIAGKPLDGVVDFEQARESLYENGLNETYPMGSEYDPTFVDAVRNAQYGTFIYAKKYRQGYALKYEDSTWYFAQALTTPLEELVPDWVVIVTAVLPFHDQYVCDGLIVDRHTLIGKNMIHDMIQELKAERAKYSSKKAIERARQGGPVVGRLRLWKSNEW